MKYPVSNEIILILEELGFVPVESERRMVKFVKGISCLDAKAEMVYCNSIYTTKGGEYYLNIFLNKEQLCLYAIDSEDISKEKIEETYLFYSFIANLIYYLFDEVISRNFVFRKTEVSLNLFELDVVYAQCEAREFVIFYDPVFKNIKCFMFATETHDFLKSVHITHEELCERNINSLALDKVKDIHAMIIDSLADQK